MDILKDPLFDLQGTVALVTGAGQRAGRSIARLLARQGAAVIVNDIVPDLAAEVAEEIRAAGGRAHVQAYDVTDLEQVRAGVAQATAALGPVDILINNAGNGGAKEMPHRRFQDMTPEMWQGTIDVNLYGVMYGLHVMLPPMIERRWGRIVTIASGAAFQGVSTGLASYGAAKAGAVGLMRHVACEVGPRGITANCVALGLIREGDSELYNAVTASLPMRRRGTPEDLASLCLYLASREAGWITGQTIHLNGGAYTT
jgi:NAD(P)-dependent dehydrogenase (short-subunit alcohol dehydrogenase family)